MAAMKKIMGKYLPTSTFMKQDQHATVPSSPIDELTDDAYDEHIESLKAKEYPTLIGTTYLDHAGTTPYATSVIELWSAELTTNLLGNPHSASAASQLCARRIEDTRLKVLEFFDAKPSDFDVVFVANATAAIKLVAEAFRDSPDGFCYGYHTDSHTSLVGVRELAIHGSNCFKHKHDLHEWLKRSQTMITKCSNLIALPAQSNMTGRKLNLDWITQARESGISTGRPIYTLLDAANLVSTSPLDLSDATTAPDFIALSFYKIFGFPDLGALIVRKQSAHTLLNKRYFAGGTVDAVATSKENWHAKKEILHECLEEGTLPFHNILALEHAMKRHRELFGSMAQISQHTARLRQLVLERIKRVRHANGVPVVVLYQDGEADKYGPLLALNLQSSSQKLHDPTEIEKLCVVKGIQLRTGGLCNPGGIARHLDLSDEQVRSNYLSGHRCGGTSLSDDGKVIGVIRISFGAMSTLADVKCFIEFISEYFVEHTALSPEPPCVAGNPDSFCVQELSVFPIKSCAAFRVPSEQKWPVTARGLAYDREWCLIHNGSGVALSQKHYPRMTLLQPRLDLTKGEMIVSTCGLPECLTINISLADDMESVPISGVSCHSTFALRGSKVCGDNVNLHVSTSTDINEFFSSFLGVSCCLARYPASEQARRADVRSPTPALTKHTMAPQVMLANESPILIVSQSSVDELNRQIASNATKRNSDAVNHSIDARTFRANIVVESMNLKHSSHRTAYAEDNWHTVSITSPARMIIGPNLRLNASVSRSNRIEAEKNSSCSSDSDVGSFLSPNLSCSSSSSLTPAINDAESEPSLVLTILGPCQRCQMVAVDQATSEHRQEPYSTLAKTRRKGDGRVWFGVHAAPILCNTAKQRSFIQVGDIIQPR